MPSTFEILAIIGILWFFACLLGAIFGGRMIKTGQDGDSGRYHQTSDERHES